MSEQSVTEGLERLDSIQESAASKFVWSQKWPVRRSETLSRSGLGGPYMTIFNVIGEGDEGPVECVWSDGKEIFRTEFPLPRDVILAPTFAEIRIFRAQLMSPNFVASLLPDAVNSHVWPEEDVPPSVSPASESSQKWSDPLPV